MLNRAKNWRWIDLALRGLFCGRVFRWPVVQVSGYSIALRLTSSLSFLSISLELLGAEFNNLALKFALLGAACFLGAEIFFFGAWLV